MIDQQIDTIETRLMRLERANQRLAWLFGTVVVIAAVSISVLGMQMLNVERSQTGLLLKQTRHDSLSRAGGNPADAGDLRTATGYPPSRE